jgi:hypothetical protein
MHNHDQTSMHKKDGAIWIVMFMLCKGLAGLQNPHLYTKEAYQALAGHAVVLDMRGAGMQTSIGYGCYSAWISTDDDNDDDVHRSWA